MNIQIQCCGIVLLLMLLLFYSRQKRIYLDTEKAFLRSLLVTMLCVTLDILSVIAIEQMNRLPILLVALICKAYLVSLVGVALCALLYVCTDIYNRKNDVKKACWYMVFAAVGGVLIFLAPIYYYYDGQTALYTYGPATLITYGFALALLAVSFYQIFSHRKKLNPKRQQAVIIWITLWVLASVIQFFNNELLIIGYAGSLGIMIVYLILENPEANLDRKTGLFNQNALIQYVQQLYGKEQEFAMISMVLERSFNKKMDAESGQLVKMEIIKEMRSIPHAQIFKNTEDEMILVFDNKKEAEEGGAYLSSRFSYGWGKDGAFFLRPSWVYVPDANIVHSAQDLLYTVKYLRQNSRELSENHFVCMDEAAVYEMYQEKKAEQLLISAIEQNRIEVYYQPIYSTEEQCFTSAEALVRIRDENGKLVPPGLFINVAEKNGMILRLGEIVFEKVCLFLTQNDIEKLGMHYIEVNLSVVQCAYEQLAQKYIEIMQKYGINPKQINLEITESASLSAKRTLLDNMQRLIEYGVRFSLDDFGTGQSNLNYIVDMPVDIVKFDKDMTTAYFENGKAKYVMDAAMHMIHGLKLKIVSEGIETKEQYEVMKQLGINYIQGYYFSKPRPEQDFIQFICDGQAGKA